MFVFTLSYSRPSRIREKESTLLLCVSHIYIAPSCYRGRHCPVRLRPRPPSLIHLTAHIEARLPLDAFVNRSLDSNESGSLSLTLSALSSSKFSLVFSHSPFPRTQQPTASRSLIVSGLRNQSRISFTRLTGRSRFRSA